MIFCLICRCKVWGEASFDCPLIMTPVKATKLYRPEHFWLGNNRSSAYVRIAKISVWFTVNLFTQNILVFTYIHNPCTYCWQCKAATMVASCSEQINCRCSLRIYKYSMRIYRCSMGFRTPADGQSYIRITIIQSHSGKYHEFVAVCIVTSVQHV